MKKQKKQRADLVYELWRQDDNGHKFLIETFTCQADAVKAMKEVENRLHKQTYWIEKTKC